MIECRFTISVAENEDAIDFFFSLPIILFHIRNRSESNFNCPWRRTILVFKIMSAEKFSVPLSPVFDFFLFFQVKLFPLALSHKKQGNCKTDNVEIYCH